MAKDCSREVCGRCDSHLVTCARCEGTGEEGTWSKSRCGLCGGGGCICPTHGKDVGTYSARSAHPVLDRRQVRDVVKIFQLIRRSAGLSSAQLAREVGIDPRLMNKIEQSGGALLTPELAAVMQRALRKHGATAAAASVIRALVPNGCSDRRPRLDGWAGRCLEPKCECTNFKPSSADVESDAYFECATCHHDLEQHEYSGRR